MLYESSLEFGRNSKAINEAYAKMYNEGAEDSEYRLLRNGEEVPTTDSDELTDEEMEAYRKSRQSRKLAQNRKTIRRRPDWLVSGAKAAGKDIAQTVEEPEASEETDDKTNSSDEEFFAILNGTDTQPEETTPSNAASSEETSVEDEDEEGDEPSDPALVEDGTYFYDNVIASNPDEFNETRYDMDLISRPTSKKVLMNNAMKYIEQGLVSSPEEAVKKILFEAGLMKPEAAEEYKEIHSSVYGNDSAAASARGDSVGNIDATDDELKAIEKRIGKHENHLSDEDLLSGLNHDEDGFIDA